jgi:endoglucanase
MNPKALSQIARRLLSCPAAPYHEAAVRAEVEAICSENRLSFHRDSYGNDLVRLQTAPKLRPFVLAAHMDHPGFEILGPLPRGRWRAEFQGGVSDEYFKPGVPLRLMPGAVPAKLGKRLGREKVFDILPLKVPKSDPKFAVWELVDFTLRRGQIHARACDDLVGVAAILSTLIELKRSRARVHVIGVIARAEEIGFRGALAVASSGQLPRNSLIISLETSRELPPAKMGQGVIIRVGDRTSVFDSTATRFLQEVAAALKRKDRSFQYQRALMYGGTCEATAYQEYGFQTSAVCVALGNYHNCAPKSKIAAEYVSLADASTMVDLLAAAAKQMSNFHRLTGALPKRLEKLFHQSRKRLLATATQ